jgi:broad specificity phosphatase PhoE
LITYIHDTKSQKQFVLNEKILVDFRITEFILPELQDKKVDYHITVEVPTNKKLSPKGESVDDVFARSKKYLQDISKEYTGKTILTISHGEPCTLIRKTFRDFDYITRMDDFFPKN